MLSNQNTYESSQILNAMKHKKNLHTLELSQASLDLWSSFLYYARRSVSITMSCLFGLVVACGIFPSGMQAL